MAVQDIKTTLRDLLVKTLRLQIEPADVGETDLIDQLGIDSLGALEILTRIENTFHIVIDDADISPALVDSLDTLTAYITAKQDQHLTCGP